MIPGVVALNLGVRERWAPRKSHIGHSSARKDSEVAYLGVVDVMVPGFLVDCKKKF